MMMLLWRSSMGCMLPGGLHLSPCRSASYPCACLCPWRYLPAWVAICCSACCQLCPLGELWVLWSHSSKRVRQCRAGRQARQPRGRRLVLRPPLHFCLHSPSIHHLSCLLRPPCSAAFCFHALNSCSALLCAANLPLHHCHICSVYKQNQHKVHAAPMNHVAGGCHYLDW